MLSLVYVTEHNRHLTFDINALNGSCSDLGDLENYVHISSVKAGIFCSAYKSRNLFHFLHDSAGEQGQLRGPHLFLYRGDADFTVVKSSIAETKSNSNYTSLVITNIHSYAICLSAVTMWVSCRQLGSFTSVDCSLCDTWNLCGVINELKFELITSWM